MKRIAYALSACALVALLVVCMVVGASADTYTITDAAGNTTTGSALDLPANTGDNDVWLVKETASGNPVGIYSGAQTVALSADVTYAEAKLGLTMLDGAGVRLSDKSGIRFETTVYRPGYLEIVEFFGAENLSVGTVIVPDTYFASASDFTVPALTAAHSYVANVKITGFNYRTISETENVFGFFASLVDLKAANYTKTFAARSYVKVGETYVYSAYNAEDHSRSIETVANAALADTGKSWTSAQDFTLNDYVGKVVRYDAAGNTSAGVTTALSGNTLTLSSDSAITAKYLVWGKDTFLLSNLYPSSDGKSLSVSKATNMTNDTVTASHPSSSANAVKIFGEGFATDSTTFAGRTVYTLTKLAGKGSTIPAGTLKANGTDTYASDETLGSTYNLSGLMQTQMTPWIIPVHGSANFVAEMSIYLGENTALSEAGNNALIKINISNPSTSKNLYCLVLKDVKGTKGATERFVFADETANGAGTLFASKVEFEVGRWINVRVVFSFTSADDFVANVYAGYEGESLIHLAESKNCHTDTATYISDMLGNPASGISVVGQGRAIGSFSFSDLNFYSYTAKPTMTSSLSGSWVNSCKGDSNSVNNSGDNYNGSSISNAISSVADPTGVADNKVLAITRPVTGGATWRIQQKEYTTAATGSYFEYSFDMILPSRGENNITDFSGDSNKNQTLLYRVQLCANGNSTISAINVHVKIVDGEVVGYYLAYAWTYKNDAGTTVETDKVYSKVVFDLDEKITVRVGYTVDASNKATTATVYVNDILLGRETNFYASAPALANGKVRIAIQAMNRAIGTVYFDNLFFYEEQ